MIFKKIHRVAIGVFAVHILAIFMFSLQHLTTQKKPKRKMVVQTFYPPPVVVQPEKVFSEPKVIKEKKNITPAQSKPAVSKPKPVAHKPKSTTSIKKQSFQEKTTEQMLQEIGRNFVELKEEKKISPVAEIALPQPVTIFKGEDFSYEKGTYGEELALYLRHMLDLPEIGEVQVDLEIDLKGHIVQLEIIESKSKKNEDFIKKRLLELNLPCFNENQKNNETVKFSIIFKNL